jgi:hypothetical protein
MRETSIKIMSIQTLVPQKRRFRLIPSFATLLTPFADMDDRVLRENRLRAQARNEGDRGLFKGAGVSNGAPAQAIRDDRR